MGLCSAKDGSGVDPDQKNQSRDVDRQIVDDALQDAQVNKLLLLGAGQSGKSTLFKQMITIYGKGFSENERKNYKNIIYNNIVASAKTLCEQSDKYGSVSDANRENKRMVLETLREDEVITEEIGQIMKSLWKDSGIQKTYENQSKFQLNDSTAYFFERIDEVSKENYIPSQQDVLRSRVPTTGIVETPFEIDGSSFKMFDVGGQRSERKKWIHCFENVTAVLFVAAMNEYDMVLYEDEQANRLTESLDLFEEITNSEWFEKTSMILFLNKSDLFAEKIKKVPLTEFFKEFKGDPTSFQDSAEFMQDLFERRNQQDKDVYSHFTCATDTENVFVVFNSVKDIIIKKGLARAGLM